MPVEQVKAFLDSMLTDTLTGFMADEIDLSESYEEFRTYRNVYYQELVKEYFNEAVRKKISVDSLEAVEFYHARRDLFEVPEQVFLYHILVSPTGFKLGPDSLKYRRKSAEEIETEARQTAFRVKSLIDSGMTFQQAATEYSHDSHSKGKGGLVGWTERKVYHPPFDSVAFALKSGEVAEPYLDRDGWHIVMITDRHDAGLQPLDSVFYQSAYNTLMTVRINELGRKVFDSLMALPLEITYNEPVLDTNLYLVTKGVWAAIVNGADTLDFYDLQSLEETYRRNNRVDNTTPEMKKDMAQNLARRLVLVQAARNFGADTLPPVRKVEYETRHGSSKRYYSYRQSDPLWTPARDQIEKYYNEHIEEFRVEKPLEVQHIITSDSITGELVRDQALAGVDFMELAEQYYPGELSIRTELSNLGWVGPQDLPAPIWEAAVRLPVGEISRPVQSQYGYHIIKLINRQDSRSLDDVAGEIVGIFKQQHDREVLKGYRDQLYAHYGVSFPGKLHPVHLRPLDMRREGQ
jgi:parvulin-like peptidyl-prolyl isomerase